MAHEDNPQPDTLLRRSQTAHLLTKNGYPTATSTLASLRTRGGGPPFRHFGRIPLYRAGDALAWAEARLSAPHADARQRADETTDSTA